MQQGGGDGGFGRRAGRATGCRLRYGSTRPGAGPGGETIANGHRGNSGGHGSTDHMLIGGLVAERLILKALRSHTCVLRFLAVKISILAGKSTRTNFLPPSGFFFPASVGLQDHTQAHKRVQEMHKNALSYEAGNMYTQIHTVALLNGIIMVLKIIIMMFTV